MDEIFELQKKLREVQAAESVQRLSDRNVVDLILKLKELGLVELIYTLSGKEFLTPSQLRDEVNDEITANGGRVRLDEISTVLNIDFVHVERATKEVVAQDPDMELLGGIEIITSWYLDSIAEEANENLQETGKATMGELATRYSLPVDVIQNAIKARVGQQISGFLSNGVLYTQAFMDREIARVRGALSASSRPITVAQIASAQGLSVSATDKHVKALIDSKVLPGKLSGGEYVPFIFGMMQRKAIDSYISSNGYVTKSLVAKYFVKKPLKFIQEAFPGSIELKTCFVTAPVLESFEATVDECIANNSFLEVSAALNPSFTKQDCAVLCGKLSALASRRTKKATLLQGGEHEALYIVSNGLTDAIKGVVNDQASQLGRKFAAQRKSSGFVVGGGNVGSASSQNLEHETEESSNRSGSKKGGKRAKGKRRGKGAVSDDEDDQAVSRNSKSAVESDPVYLEGLKELTGDNCLGPCIEKHCQEVGIHDVSSEFTELLKQDISAFAQQIYKASYDETLHSVFQGSTAVRRKMTETVEQDAQTQYLEFQLYAKGISVFSQLAMKSGAIGSETLHSIQQSLVDELGRKVVKSILLHQYVLNWTDAEFPSDKSVLDSAIEQVLSDPSVRTKFVQSQTCGSNINTITQALNKSHHTKITSDEPCALINTFSEVLATQISEISMHVRSLDKKTERPMLHSIRQGNLAILQDSTQPMGTRWFAAVAQVLQQIHGSVPWCIVPNLGLAHQSEVSEDILKQALVKMLQEDLGDEAVDVLKQVADSDNSEQDADNSDLVSKLESLATSKDPTTVSFE